MRISKFRLVYNSTRLTAAVAGAAILALLFLFVPSSVPGILTGLAVGSLVVLIWVIAAKPAILVKFIIWLLFHTVYRMTVVGAENLPVKGGALLVSNTISYIDHLLILVSIERPVKFFVGREFYDNPWLKPLVRLFRGIPVDRKDSPKTIAKALLEARKAVANGELVCIFAEGSVTRIGNLLPFGRGMEFIMKGLKEPIIPMHLDRIWGSTFSMVDGKLAWRLPKIIPYPITVSFGRPMPPDSKTHKVRLAVQELSADAFKLRGENQKKLHIAFLETAKKRPFRFCMADSLGTELTYGKALAGVLALKSAVFSSNRGRSINENIGLLLPTSCISVLANCAVMFAGKVPVNLNYTMPKPVIDSCARQCGMKLIITTRTFLEKVNIEPDGRMVFLEDLKAKISPAVKLLYFLAVLALPAWLLKKVFLWGDKTTIDDVATVIFSSGSTGEPKGIMLTHQNIASNIESAYQIFNIRQDDIFMGILPFFHSFGYTATLWLPLYAGVSMVYHTNPLDAATVGEMVQKYKARLILGTPTFLAAYTRKCTKEQFASLRFVVAGAEKLKQSIAETFYEKFGVPPFEGYGCSELSPVVSLGIPSYIHPEGRFVQVGNKPGTVGHPMPGIAAKVVNPETFEDLPMGSEGLLMIRGPNVMKGYLNNPEKTAEVIRDGWYATGDIVRLDEDGFIAITDRLSRFSKIAGEMVPHVRIEEEIQGLLGENSPACAVTSVPDERKGEKLVVLYKGEVDIKKLWDKLNSSSLSKLWLPKRECFYRIDEIPVLGSGKLDLRKIKDMAVEFTKNDAVRPEGENQHIQFGPSKEQWKL